jgi:hypothetical protein
MGRGAAGVNFIKLKGDATLASFSLAPADAEDETPATAVDGEGTPVAEGVTEAPTAEVAPEATEAPAETPEA